MRGWATPAMVALSVAVLLFGTGGFWSATWLSKWALIMGLGATALSLWAARATSLWHLPLLLYAFGSLLALAAWPQSPYAGGVDGVTLLAIQKNAYAGLLAFAALVWGVAYTARNTARLAYGALLGVCVIWGVGCLATLILPLDGPLSPPSNGLFFGNPSMGAGLLACLLPVVLEWAQPARYLQVAAAALTWVVILRTRASVPWGVLGVTCAAWVFHRSGARAKTLLGIAAAAGVMLALGHWLVGHEFFENTGRFEVWEMAWGWFREQGSLMWGLGLSSSQVLLPLEQVTTNHFHGSYFLWLHNDWLQLLIEGGVVGFACVLLSTARLFTEAWRTNSALFASLAGFACLAVFNYPLRMPVHCYILALLCGLIEGLSPAVRYAEKIARRQAAAEKTSNSMPV